MAVSITNLTASNDTTTQTTRNTASRAVTSGRVYLLALTFDRNMGTITITGNSETYTVAVGPQLWGSTSGRRVFIYRWKATSSATYAITIANTNTAVCFWSWEEVTGMDTTGTNGAGAIGDTDSGGNSGTATSGSVPALTLQNTNSACYAVFGHQANEVTTPGSGFTELADRNLSSTHGFETEWKLNETTATASWSTSSDWGSAAVEIKAPVVDVTVNDTGSAATSAALVPAAAAGCSPAVVTATAAGLASVTALSVTATVAAATSDGLAPSVTSGLTADATVAAATSAGLAPAPSVSVTATVAAATSAALVPASLGSGVTATVAAATSAGLAPAVTSSRTATVATATAACIAPFVTFDILAASLASAPAPEVYILRGATAQALAPALSQENAPLSPVAAALANAPAAAPLVELGALVVTATSTALTPVVALSVNSALALTTATAPAPSLVADGGPVLALATVASASATVLATDFVASVTSTVSLAFAIAWSEPIGFIPVVSVEVPPNTATALGSGLLVSAMYDIALLVVEATATADAPRPNPTLTFLSPRQPGMILLIPTSEDDEDWLTPVLPSDLTPIPS